MPSAALNVRRLPRTAAVLLALAVLAGLLAGSVAAIRAATGTAETEVRIVAKHLDSGATELALQQRAPGGNWGTRILPRLRYLGSDAPADRWLSSSPVTVSLAVAETAPDSDVHTGVDPSAVDAGQSASDAAAPDPPAGFEPFSVEEQAVHGNWTVRTFDRGSGPLTTVMARPSGGAYAAASRADYIAFGFSCLPGVGLDFVTANFSGFEQSGPTARVAWSLDQGAPTVEQWAVWAQFGTVHLSPERDRAFMSGLRDAERLYLTVWAPAAVHQVAFGLEGMFATPAQPNLDYCGNY